MKKKVRTVSLREITDDDGIIDADGVIAEDVVSKTLAVIIPAGTSLNALRQRQLQHHVISQLSQHGITNLKVKNLEKQKARLHNLSENN